MHLSAPIPCFLLAHHPTALSLLVVILKLERTRAKAGFIWPVIFLKTVIHTLEKAVTKALNKYHYGGLTERGVMCLANVLSKRNSHLRIISLSKLVIRAAAWQNLITALHYVTSICLYAQCIFKKRNNICE
ncbi:hypothetical protein XELAEV_18011501mg [Xenopus laevis]|uniref:Secreted protein n=1 Tax=Xenopus laevis TaxID=8355 RepID=A0A974HXI5_XENLA|nr:hypothetical protein XELAEV_18011501mg [Xenopus laevis]